MLEFRFNKMAFAILPLLLAASVSFSQTADSWISVRSANFHLMGNAAERDLVALANRLERFRWALGQVIPGVKLDSKAQTRFIVFRDAAAYRPFKPKRSDGTLDDGVAGFFIAGDDVNYVTLSLDRGVADSTRTAFHEYLHSLLATNLSGTGLPLWLNEGLAEYFETMSVDEGGNVALGSAPKNHVRILRNRTRQPIASLVQIDVEELYQMSRYEREFFYAQAWVVTHYLFDNGCISRATLLSRLSRLSLTSEEDFLGLTTPGIDTAIDAHLLKKSLSTEILKISLPTEAPKNELISKLTQAETNAFLGDLLLRSNDATAAENYLRRALVDTPSSAIANSSLGRLLVRQEKFAEAIPYLERAAAASRDHLVLYNLAYALSHEAADSNGEVSEYTPERLRRMRELLTAAASIRPKFGESHRLLAFIELVAKTDLDSALAHAREAFALDSANPEFQLILAQVLLRRENYDEAKIYADRLIKNASIKTEIRREATAVLEAVREYDAAAKATRLIVNQISNSFPPIILLKRSWLSETDLKLVETNRQINNLNRILIRPATDESQLVGRIEHVVCDEDEIRYIVSAGAEKHSLSGKSFDKLRVTVLIEGENSFEIDCGKRFDKNLTVLNYKPSKISNRSHLGELTAISFVPDDFRLKSTTEMTGARTVVVEDDVKNSLRKIEFTPGNPDTKTRYEAIAKAMRKSSKDEVRVAGTIGEVTCSEGKTTFHLTVSGSERRFTAATGSFTVNWFTVESTQLPIACGSVFPPASIVLTYEPNKRASKELTGKVIAIEFVPSGYSFTP
ncbi:MAG: tetratricopeptide repeat protein [Acidobacteria bacterium]|nr:tetratricopeptide repeat protein [Acidobacteriota bacterium]